MHSRLVKDVLKMLALLVGIIVLCRVTKGVAAGALVLYACFAALSQKNWIALSCFILFPFLMMMNGAILPKAGLIGWCIRLGLPVMAICFAISAVNRTGRHRLPLGGLFFYLFGAIFSSMEGYCPMISYMKVLNFVVFLLGIWLGTRNMHHNGEELYKLRCAFLAIGVLIIFGSWAVWPFPGIAYPQTINSMMQYGGLTAQEAALRAGEMRESSYFAGIANHSNTLAPMLSCFVGYLLCDMLFVEGRFSKFHGILIGCSLPLMYLTKSRGAFVTLVAAITMIYFYGIASSPVRRQLKTKARSIIMVFIAVIAAGIVVLELRGDSFSKYLRKHDNVKGDRRSLTEAVTSSRMGLVEDNLSDFWKNPLLGMGFQTASEHAWLYHEGRISIFSAPIEKGVLPLMILGETGVVGAVLFGIWLVMFVGTCRRLRYVCVVCLFFTMLASNLGEASFFSPGGVGGVLWIITVVGGYVCDLQAVYRRNLAKRMARLNMM